MNILLAVDGSSYTQKMLAYLAEHNPLLSPAHHYTALTVCTALPPRAYAGLSKDEADSYYADEAAKVLRPITELLAQQKIDVQTAYQIGPVGETIAVFADSGQFDLIVMGSHGHSALGNLVMGSVATQVLALCKVPVLVVR